MQIKWIRERHKLQEFEVRDKSKMRVNKKLEKGMNKGLEQILKTLFGLVLYSIVKSNLL